MKRRVQIVASVVLLISLGMLLIVLAFPKFTATRYGYFDVNNGRKKVELVSIGRVFRQSIEDTEYSRLLEKLGFKEMAPNWRLSTQEEVGIQRFVRAQHVDYYIGKIEADSKEFALLMDSGKTEDVKKRELTKYYRTLVHKGDDSEIRQFIERLNQQK